MMQPNKAGVSYASVLFGLLTFGLKIGLKRLRPQEFGSRLTVGIDI